MSLVCLPTLQFKATDTLVHTTLSVGHALFARYDAVIVFNAANAPVATLLKVRRTPYAVHVDGLEWQRLKWGRVARRYYLWCERLATRTATALIADAHGIQSYYSRRYSVPSVYIPYGVPAHTPGASSGLHELDLIPGRYHLIVARLEPENHVHLGIAGFAASGAKYPLVVVGDAPYGGQYVQSIRKAAAPDGRIRLIGSVWDQDLLDQLYANASSYIHGHSVGGTNPSLLRAMGCGAPVLAYDVVFNREVLGRHGRFFSTPGDLAPLVQWAEDAPSEASHMAVRAQARASDLYDWDEVATDYERLLAELAGSIA
jgi:glycosyltransferase involved in cell wall biosynthesis